MPKRRGRGSKAITSVLLPIFGSMLVGSIIIVAAGSNPIATYINIFETGFTCQWNSNRCALIVTVQFATPLILTGLSAAVALWANFITLGQAGQMLLGAAGATWVASNINLPAPYLPAVALAAGALAGAIWGFFPALLREFLGMNEIITTLLFNPLAIFILGFVRLRKFPAQARLLPIIPRTKITVGIFLAVFLVWVVYILLWKTKTGYNIRNSAQSPRFSHYGGIKQHLPILGALLISGGLAGLAGAVEVLGVHYKYVGEFTAVNNFDGLIIAIAGQLHPLGVLLFAFLIGGLRNGAITGMQIRSGIPRELGGALIALMLIFAAMHKYHRDNGGKNKHGSKQ